MDSKKKLIKFINLFYILDMHITWPMNKTGFKGLRGSVDNR